MYEATMFCSWRPAGSPAAVKLQVGVFCSKQIHFGLMDAKEIVKTAELHVYERSLYKVSGPRVGFLVQPGQQPCSPASTSQAA